MISHGAVGDPQYIAQQLATMTEQRGFCTPVNTNMTIFAENR